MAVQSLNETGQPEIRKAIEEADMTGDLYGAAADDTVVADLVDLEAVIVPTIAEMKALGALFFPDSGGAGADFWSGYTSVALPADPADTAAANRVEIIKQPPAGDRPKYTDTWPVKLAMKGEQGGVFEVTAGFAGKTRTTHGSSVSAPTAGNKSRFGDCAIEVGGTALAFNDIDLSLEWVIETDNNNNITRDAIGVARMAAMITLGANVNATTRPAFYDILNTGTTAAVDFQVENGSAGWGFHFGAVYWTGPDQAPQDGDYWKGPLVGEIRTSDILFYTK